jgi:hypothetical protein
MLNFLSGGLDPVLLAGRFAVALWALATAWHVFCTWAALTQEYSVFVSLYMHCNAYTGEHPPAFAHNRF